MVPAFPVKRRASPRPVCSTTPRATPLLRAVTTADPASSPNKLSGGRTDGRGIKHKLLGPRGIDDPSVAAAVGSPEVFRPDLVRCRPGASPVGIRRPPDAAGCRERMPAVILRLEHRPGQLATPSCCGRRSNAAPGSRRRPPRRGLSPGVEAVVDGGKFAGCQSHPLGEVFSPRWSRQRSPPSLPNRSLGAVDLRVERVDGERGGQRRGEERDEHDGDETPQDGQGTREPVTRNGFPVAVSVSPEKMNAWKMPGRDLDTIESGAGARPAR